MTSVKTKVHTNKENVILNKNFPITKYSILLKNSFSVIFLSVGLTNPAFAIFEMEITYTRDTSILEIFDFGERIFLSSMLHDSDCHLSI